MIIDIFFGALFPGFLLGVSMAVLAARHYRLEVQRVRAVQVYQRLTPPPEP
jgi:hypothetical protein